jgi:hypothetical protein
MSTPEINNEFVRSAESRKGKLLRLIRSDGGAPVNVMEQNACSFVEPNCHLMDVAVVT